MGLTVCPLLYPINKTVQKTFINAHTFLHCLPLVYLFRDTHLGERACISFMIVSLSPVKLSFFLGGGGGG